MTRLTRLHYLAYSLGHVLNDAAAVMWFSYGLFFLHELCNVPAATSGLILFAGQVADAVATPLVGILSDATPLWLPGGRRLVWIALGCACVVITFPTFFSPAVAATPVRSAVVASVFNVGWAMTQVAHLSLAPDMGGGERAQLLLSAVRQVATVVASTCAFVLVRVALALLPSPPSAAASAAAFHGCARLVVGAGAATTACCVGLVALTQRRQRAAERKTAADATSSVAHRASRASRERARLSAAPTESVTESVRLGEWLQQPLFWAIGLQYTCARLSINLTATYVPLLLLEVCGRTVDEVASVPILMYVGQIAGAVCAERLCMHVGKPRALLLSALLSAGASLALRLLLSNALPAVVGAVCVQALASSTVLVVVVAMQADAARAFPWHGHGFLYGTHSMLDKLSSGLAIVLLQRLAQRSARGGSAANGMALPAGGAARSAFVLGACVVPCAAATLSAVLCARAALAPPTAAEGERSEARAARAHQIDTDVLARPLLPAHP